MVFNWFSLSFGYVIYINILEIFFSCIFYQFLKMFLSHPATNDSDVIIYPGIIHPGLSNFLDVDCYLSFIALNSHFTLILDRVLYSCHESKIKMLLLSFIQVFKHTMKCPTQIAVKYGMIENYAMYSRQCV